MLFSHLAAAPLNEDAARRIVSIFLKKLETIGPARYLFLFDADRQHLDSGPHAEDAPELRPLLDVLDSIGARPIDPTDAFRTHLAETGKKPEVGPYVRHWNAEAVNILSTLIAEKLITGDTDPSWPPQPLTTRPGRGFCGDNERYERHAEQPTAPSSVRAKDLRCHYCRQRSPSHSGGNASQDARIGPQTCRGRCSHQWQRRSREAIRRAHGTSDESEPAD